MHKEVGKLKTYCLLMKWKIPHDGGVELCTGDEPELQSRTATELVPQLG